MFKRLICDATGKLGASATGTNSATHQRSGKIAKLALLAGAALMLPAAWPLIEPIIPQSLMAELPLPLPEFGDDPAIESTQSSALPLPDQTVSILTNEDRDSDAPPFDLEPKLKTGVNSQLASDLDELPPFDNDNSEPPPFDMQVSQTNDTPPFDDDQLVTADFQSGASKNGTRQVSVLSAEDVKNLLTRARLELAAGDIELAHRFAEAAAEVPIPIEFFKARPQSVLDEIEFTTQLRNADYRKAPVAKSAPNDEANLPEPPEFATDDKTQPMIEVSAPDPKTVVKNEPLEEDPFEELTPQFVSKVETSPVLESPKPTAISLPDTVIQEPQVIQTEAAPVTLQSAAQVAPMLDLELEPRTIVPTPSTVAQNETQKVKEEPTPTPSAKPAPDTPVVVKPLSPTERLKKAPRAYQALTMRSLNVQPKALNGQTTPPRLPDSPARAQLANAGIQHHPTGVGRDWATTVYMWEAPAYRHDPLYFEEPQLERYGNEVPFVQPITSFGHFMGSAATLPYQMAIEDNGPIMEQYDLEADRPGDCVPYSWQRLPWSNTGALVQTGTVLGLIFIIP